MTHGEQLGLIDTAALRDRLTAVGWTSDAVRARIGESAQAALGRNTTIAAERALAGADDPQATLTRLWILQRRVPLAAWRSALTPGLADQLEEAGVVERVGAEEVAARLELRPYAFTDDHLDDLNHDDADPAATHDAWFFSDLTPGLDGPPGPLSTDHVLGVTPASTSLTRMTMPVRGAVALDLGTGCGVQSLHLARRFERVVATDLNPRALRFAAVNLALNGVADRVDLREGSFYEPVGGERFDLIVSNPPYVMAPPRPAEERLTYREGEHRGDGLVRHVVQGAADHLTPGASVQVLGNWAHLDGSDWRERLAGWAPPGCELRVWQREELDPAEYVEIWLADAGLTTSAQWPTRYRAWLDYFDAEAITGVGLGWLLLTRLAEPAPTTTPGAGLPALLEAWPHPVEQPVGAALLAERDARAAAAAGEEDLLAGHWRLRPDVVAETIGQPGAADPQHVVLRQQRGLRRAVRVDTALGGVLGACDGELTLGAIVDAVAALLDLDANAVRGLEPGLREAVAHGFLVGD